MDRLVYTKAVELKQSTAQPSSEPPPSDQSASLRTVVIVVPIILTGIVLSAVLFLVVRFRRRQPKRKKRVSIDRNSLIFINSLITPYTLQLSDLIGTTRLGLGEKLPSNETVVARVRPTGILPLPAITSSARAPSHYNPGSDPALLLYVIQYVCLISSSLPITPGMRAGEASLLVELYFAQIQRLPGRFRLTQA